MLEMRLWLDITTGTCTTNYNIATNYNYHTLLSFSRSLVENICWLTDSFHLRLQGSSKLAQHPTLAILFAIQGLMSFAMAHAEVQVPDTLWKEPGVLWLAIGMPTGKTILVSNVSSSNLFQCNVVHILVYSFKTVLHKLMPNCLLNEWIKTGESRKRFVPSQIRMLFASHHFGFVFFCLIAVHGKDIFTVNLTELID